MFSDINALDMNVLERIEVIKGTTAVYGNGSNGKIIDLSPKNLKKGRFFQT